MFKIPSHLLHLLDIREPGARASWKALTPAQLEKFQSEVKNAHQNWEQDRKTIKRYVFAMTAVLFAVGLNSGWQGYQQGEPLWHAAFYALGMSCLSLWGFLILGMLNNTRGESLRHLRMFFAPLSLPNYSHACATALRLVKEVSEADAYRREVLATGRELVFGDVRVMEELQHVARREADLKDYRELHRLAPNSVS